VILLLVSPRQRGLDVSAALGDRARDCVAVVAGDPRPTGVRPAGVDHVATVAGYTTDELVETGLRLAGRHRFDRVVSFAEADVIAAAILRDKLGLPGQQPDSALAYRDKALMREHTASAGLPTPRFWYVTDAARVRALAASHGLPLVCKPRWSSGSVGVRILRTRSDLDGLPDNLPDHLVEEYVEGDVVHVDALLVAGRPVFALPAAYTGLACLSHLDDQGSGSYLLPTTHPRHADLVTELWRVVAALPAAPNLVLHAEFFVPDGGRPVLCEIASRMPGHPIPPMIDRALGIELRRVWLRAEAGSYLDTAGLAAAADTAMPVANYGLPPRLGTLVDVPDVVPAECAGWTHDLRALAPPGDRWDAERYAARKSGDFVLTWTVSAPDHATLATRVERAAEALGRRVRWA
jgi:hypothetical protein